MMCHIILILSHWVRELVESILHSLQKTMVVSWCIVLESSSAIPKVCVLFFLVKMMKRKKNNQRFYVDIHESRQENKTGVRQIKD